MNVGFNQTRKTGSERINELFEQLKKEYSKMETDVITTKNQNMEYERKRKTIN
jgi:hypothetical protein